MVDLLAAVGAFLLTHLIPAVGPVRAALVRAMGRRMYLATYTAISLGVVFWLIVAFRAAPVVPLWPAETWTRWVPVLVMPFSCVLLVAALSSANPLSLAVVRRRYDPDRPGIVSITRHPLMWGLALWAGAHLPPNGDGASVVLFGLLAVLSLIGPVSLDAKARADLGRAEWERLSAATGSVPFAAILAGRTRADWRGVGGVRIVAGLLLYGALLYAHPWLIGVSPLP